MRERGLLRDMSYFEPAAWAQAVMLAKKNARLNDTCSISRTPLRTHGELPPFFDDLDIPTDDLLFNLSTPPSTPSHDGTTVSMEPPPVKTIDSQRRRFPQAQVFFHTQGFAVLCL
ncbi:hypothetical protein TNCV_2285231 [Trichonephila clavipes]|nr:hypothetical protein TNCV_2285231 [Trichonephila clavipes]